MSFDAFDLHPTLNANTRALGFTAATPIQERAIPVVLSGRDVLGTAQTGTGKTAAFGLPILHQLLNGQRRRLRALIVVPTRELAEQIFEAFGEMAKGTDLHGVTLYGGVGITPQIKALRQGAEVAIACPGRLIDHMERGTIRLDAIETLVLDEADQMCDMGFLPPIRRILKALPARRQTLMFSATMPDEIRHLAEEILHQPTCIEIGHQAPVETVAHAIYRCNQQDKASLLQALLGEIDTGSVLVFTRTKHRAKRLSATLCTAGHNATNLQGNLSQGQRRQAMDGFRSGRYQIMVATDIAARGLDVSSVSHVINFDMPDTVEAYTHRIGRTGRAARQGDAFTFVTHEDQSMLRSIERRLGAGIEQRIHPDFEPAAAPSRSSSGTSDVKRSWSRAKPSSRKGRIPRFAMAR